MSDAAFAEGEAAAAAAAEDAAAAAAAAEAAGQPKQPPPVLWAELEETQIEVDEFDQLFSRPVVKPRAKGKGEGGAGRKEEKPKKAAVAKYFDQKKSQVRERRPNHSHSLTHSLFWGSLGGWVGECMLLSLPSPIGGLLLHRHVHHPAAGPLVLLVQPEPEAGRHLGGRRPPGRPPHRDRLHPGGGAHGGGDRLRRRLLLLLPDHAASSSLLLSHNVLPRGVLLLPPLVQVVGGGQEEDGGQLPGDAGPGPPPARVAARPLPLRVGGPQHQEVDGVGGERQGDEEGHGAGEVEPRGGQLRHVPERVGEDLPLVEQRDEDDDGRHQEAHVPQGAQGLLNHQKHFAFTGIETFKKLLDFFFLTTRDFPKKKNKSCLIDPVEGTISFLIRHAISRTTTTKKPTLF